jgi:hypothetical protein
LEGWILPRNCLCLLNEMADDQEHFHQGEEEGFEIISITPVLSGAYDYNTKHETSVMFHFAWGWGYGYGYGYSYTEGVVITARAREN